MTAFLLDHLWQSSVMLAVIGLLTLLFRNNGAHVRHALWMVASVKFLVPFAALALLGEAVSGLLSSLLPAPPMIESLEVVAQPFSGVDAILVAVADRGATWLPLATAAWAAGFLALGVFWFRRWMTLRAALHAAQDSDIAAPMSVKLSPSLLEPGLVGIFRPTLVLPRGIADRLAPAELQAIVAHESCHLRRHDNLTAALHMLVEAIFWFWPPVWWLGARLVLERERACDEAVVAAGNDPQAYAESILKVCKFYVRSPLACAAGVSGADLKQRVEDIMKNTVISRLSPSKKALLLSAGLALFAVPLLAGLWSPVAVAQMPAPPSPSRIAECVPPSVRATHTRPPYPPGAQEAGETGTVEMLVNVADNGTASEIRVARSSGIARLDDAATEHVKAAWRWAVGCGGFQTAVRVEFALSSGAGGLRPAMVNGLQSGAGLVIRTVDEEAGRAGAEPMRVRESGEERTVWLRRDGQLAGNILTDVGVGTDPRSGAAVVTFRFTPEAQRRFGDMTTNNVGRRLAILVDGSVLSTPKVIEPILGGQLQLQADFNRDEARMLAARAMAGSGAR
jgi:TonB family protein